MVRIRRVYALPLKSDGIRVLVDRLWPRGVSKGEAHVDLWAKEIAPSDALRKWFRHDPERWQEFTRRYRRELREPEKRNALKKIRSLTRSRRVTLVFAARDLDHNNAVVLASILHRR